MSRLCIHYKDSEWQIQTEDGHSVKGITNIKLHPVVPDQLLTATLTFEIAELDLEGVELDSIQQTVYEEVPNED